MSRKGKVPVDLPQGLKVAIEASNVKLEGPKGKLDLFLPFGIKVEEKESKLFVSRSGNTKQERANHGTIRARLANNIEGVVNGHKRDLEIQGLGFRAQLQGKKIVMQLGFSHQVEYEGPSDVNVTVPTQTTISIEGIDKVRVGQIAAEIKGLKPVEPYKGKGIRYVGEVVRKKQGKSVSK